MKRLVLFAAIVALAACAKKDEAVMDSSTAMAAPMAMTVADSTAKADSMKADSVRKDSVAKADTTKH